MVIMNMKDFYHDASKDFMNQIYKNPSTYVTYTGSKEKDFCSRFFLRMDEREKKEEKQQQFYYGAGKRHSRWEEPKPEEKKPHVLDITALCTIKCSIEKQQCAELGKWYSLSTNKNIRAYVAAIADKERMLLVVVEVFGKPSLTKRMEEKEFLRCYEYQHA